MWGTHGRMHPSNKVLASKTRKVNPLYDRFDGTNIIDLSEGNNLGDNDGFLMFWVWSIKFPKVSTLAYSYIEIYFDWQTVVQVVLYDPAFHRTFTWFTGRQLIKYLQCNLIKANTLQLHTSNLNHVSCNAYPWFKV